MRLFTGSGVALVTPFRDGDVDYEAYGKLIEFQISHGTDAIITAGTTGEPATLTQDEKMEVIRFAIEKTAKRVPVIAGTGCNCTARALEDSLEAQRMGADGLLIVTPYYNKTTPKGLVKHFHAIADAVRLPIIVYNVPSRTGMNIKPGTLVDIAKHENITAIKEASGDIYQISEMARLCGDKLDIYSGTDEIILPVLACGGIGVISVVANVAPRETHDLVAAFLKGDIADSRRLQYKLNPLVDALFRETSPIPVKTALGMMGMMDPAVRPPLCEMEPDNIELLRIRMIQFGLLHG